MAKDKYGTWKELFAAFDSGELDKNKVVIVMYNNGGYMRYDYDDKTDEEGNKFCENMFSPGGCSDIVDVLNAAGYPAKWC